MSTKPGRNDVCHCGSGAKYKRCCLEKDARTPTAASLSDDEKVFMGQLREYAAPLLASVGSSRKEFTAALEYAAACWEIAIQETPEAREAALVEYCNAIAPPTLSKAGESRATVEEMTRFMVDRHRELFPEMHPDSDVVIVDAPAAEATV